FSRDWSSDVCSSDLVVVERIVEATDPSPPRLDDTLHYDEQRGVLELAPARPETEAQTPPSHAVDIDGSIYEVDERGQVVVRHCALGRASCRDWVNSP